jgi:hypothetical protein
LDQIYWWLCLFLGLFRLVRHVLLVLSNRHGLESLLLWPFNEIT